MAGLTPQDKLNTLMNLHQTQIEKFNKRGI
jgi:hypothetical protein